MESVLNSAATVNEAVSTIWKETVEMEADFVNSLAVHSAYLVATNANSHLHDWVCLKMAEACQRLYEMRNAGNECSQSERPHLPWCDCDDCCAPGPNDEDAAPMRLPSWEQLTKKEQGKANA